MKEHQKGVIQILCEEIGAVFTPGMENTRVLVAFVAVLVDAINKEMQTAKMINHLTDKDVSGEADMAFERVKQLLLISDRVGLITDAAKAHRTVTVHDEGPCDHYIDMLSSCVSAIRFGLEVPCHSRHAAAAADHVWKHRYGLKLFDKHSNVWRKLWSRDKFYESIGNLAKQP